MKNFSNYELHLLAKLPLDVAALAEKYRIDIINAAEFWDEPPFPDNYVPEMIEIYYGNTISPHVFILNGQLEDYKLDDLDINRKSIAVQIDDQWAYIQVEGQEILNRLGGVVLPDAVIEPSALLNSILKAENHG
ncbi:hypothetical protein [Calothrix sp. NIES-2098]|uniref:hypothetical protein n=1 Tax=Calothrix sp. NIES-2098 TaxID=1954171 RepID=UPI000B5E360B|nr:hypothetical protein NIES2098_72800 [Calothrix sp. NIES-2098]